MLEVFREKDVAAATIGDRPEHSVPEGKVMLTMGGQCGDEIVLGGWHGCNGEVGDERFSGGEQRRSAFGD